MPALIDVNVALALIDGDHKANAVATTWLQEQPAGGVVLVRVVQLGLLRLLSSPVVMRGMPLSMEESWDTWQHVLRDERFRFVTAEPASIERELARLTTGKGHSPKVWTDAYIAAFAVASNLTLTTFDKGFSQYEGLQLHTLA